MQIPVSRIRRAGARCARVHSWWRDSSVLWQAIREKAGLVHGIDAQVWNPGTAGLFLISFTCDAGRRGRRTPQLNASLRAVRAPAFPPV